MKVMSDWNMSACHMLGQFPLDYCVLFGMISYNRSSLNWTGRVELCESVCFHFLSFENYFNAVLCIIRPSPNASKNMVPAASKDLELWVNTHFWIIATRSFSLWKKSKMKPNFINHKNYCRRRSDLRKSEQNITYVW